MTENHTQTIGRLLSANSSECVVSYITGPNEIPPFGSMVRMPLRGSDIDIYGVITDVTLEEDGFLRQIAGSAEISEEVIKDAQENRNVPIVLRVIYLGYREEDRILHMLPPRPPYTLTEIYRCSNSEICQFTRKLGYLRLMLNVKNIQPGELIASHMHYTAAAHQAQGDSLWTGDAVDELIDLLRDDYAGLTAVLAAVGDADITSEA